MAVAYYDSPIVDVLQQRYPAKMADERIREARRVLHTELANVKAYSGGLPVEERSAVKVRQEAFERARRVIRRAWCHQMGRRIDLVSLMKEASADGQPVWAINDPLLGDHFGWYDEQGNYCISEVGHDLKNATKDRTILVGHPIAKKLRAGFYIPALPETARNFLLNKKIQARATWVGLLFKCFEWTRIKVDPAIVVEWKNRPKEYYCLCVWGADLPHIMEFVD